MFDFFWLRKTIAEVEQLKKERIELEEKRKEIEKEIIEYTYWLEKKVVGLEHKLSLAKKYIEENESRKDFTKWYIYIIQDHTGMTKIWMTKNIKNRVMNYKTENPYWINVIYTFEHEDYIEIERELHQKVQNKNIRWEWFNLDNDDIKEIILYCERRWL